MVGKGTPKFPGLGNKIHGAGRFFSRARKIDPKMRDPSSRELDKGIMLVSQPAIDDFGEILQVPHSNQPLKRSMKQLFLPILAGLFLAPSMAFGQQRLKIATVSMERLFNEFEQTEKIQREINIERARIQRENNNKLASIREIDAKLQKIREQLKAEDLGEKQRADLLQESQDLSQDGRAKEKERTEYLERRNRTLAQTMRKQMRGILVKIQRTVSETAKEGNYDFIFDSSGNSNQGIPFVLHARETTDLTDLLLKKINDES